MKIGRPLLAVAAAGVLAAEATATALPARYLALGDSYTIGESVAESARWPVQLAALLNAEGLPAAAPQIIARTGWTTDELSAAVESAQPAGPFDLVSLLIGVNNQYRGRSPDEYRGQFRTLLQTAIELAGQRPDRVLVLSIPDWGVTAFGAASGRDVARIASEIDAFNVVAEEETRSAGAHWVGITDLTREGAADTSLVADDGLHPSAKDYARWAARALPVVRAILRPKAS